jgi:hypothetical protein
MEAARAQTPRPDARRALPQAPAHASPSSLPPRRTMPADAPESQHRAARARASASRPPTQTGPPLLHPRRCPSCRRRGPHGATQEARSPLVPTASSGTLRTAIRGSSHCSPHLPQESAGRKEPHTDTYGATDVVSSPEADGAQRRPDRTRVPHRRRRRHAPQGQPARPPELHQPEPDPPLPGPDDPGLVSPRPGRGRAVGMCSGAGENSRTTSSWPPMFTSVRPTTLPSHCATRSTSRSTLAFATCKSVDGESAQVTGQRRPPAVQGPSQVAG